MCASFFDFYLRRLKSGATEERGGIIQEFVRDSILFLFLEWDILI